MKLTIMLLCGLVVVLGVISVNAEQDAKCANWKKCSKDLRKVSGIKEDGSCTTYSNHCLLKYAILCEEQAFTTCFRGPTCDQTDETRVIGCAQHLNKDQE